MNGRPLATPLMPAEKVSKVADQKEVLAWAVRSFGEVACNCDERAARLAEEAIEIAQAEGVSLEVIVRIASRVYSRPAGDLWQELGGLGITAMAFAESVGLSLSDCTEREWHRVLSKSPEWWERKHAEKVAAGTANLSPSRCCSYCIKGLNRGECVCGHCSQSDAEVKPR
jgi:hypothetical protein